MRSFLYRMTFLSLFLITAVGSLFSRETSSPHFLGINPAVTVEPYYGYGEFDINIFPLVYQKNISPVADIRFISTVNYGFRKKSGFISHVGFQLACPLYLSGKAEGTLPLKGFFMAPGFGVTRNIGEEHTNAGLWIEPGYSFLFDDGFNLSVSFQYGATHFWYDTGSANWGKHFGIKIILGQWLGNKTGDL